MTLSRWWWWCISSSRPRPSYFADGFHRVADVDSRRRTWRLRSASTPALFVSTARISIVGDRRFDVAAARTRNVQSTARRHRRCQRLSVISRQFCSLEATPELILRLHMTIFYSRVWRLFCLFVCCLVVFWLYATIISYDDDDDDDDDIRHLWVRGWSKAGAGGMCPQKPQVIFYEHDDLSHIVVCYFALR